MARKPRKRLTKAERDQRALQDAADAQTDRFLDGVSAIERQAAEEVNNRLREFQDETDKRTAQVLRDLQYEYGASQGALSNVDIWNEHKAAVELAEAYSDFKTLAEPPVAFLAEDGRKGIAHVAKDQTKDGIGIFFRHAARLWNAKITSFVRGKISGPRSSHHLDEGPDDRPEPLSISLRQFIKEMGRARAKSKRKKPAE